MQTCKPVTVSVCMNAFNTIPQSTSSYHTWQELSANELFVFVLFFKYIYLFVFAVAGGG